MITKPTSGFTPHLWRTWSMGGGLKDTAKKYISGSAASRGSGCKTKTSSKGAGFTLIETLIYLALFALIMGGFLVVIYGIIESAGASKQKIVVEEEGSFVLDKIKWAMSGVQTINSPTAGGTAASLSVTKPGVPSNPLVFDLNGGVMRLKRGSGGTATPLTSANVTMTNLQFTDIAAVNGQPEGIAVSFRLTDQTYSEASALTIYLRK